MAKKPQAIIQPKANQQTSFVVEVSEGKWAYMTMSKITGKVTYVRVDDLNDATLLNERGAKLCLEFFGKGTKIPARKRIELLSSA